MASAGWYNTDVPNRQRWWDGSRWTEYERDIPAGWYAVPGSGEVRWRDDKHWTAYRIVNDKPRANWYATEPPLIGYVFGAIFLGLGAAQGALAFITGNPLNAIFMLLLGGFWLSAGIGGSLVRRKPRPETAPVAPLSVQPVPGQAEGPNAGWYAVTARTQRWWSGTRWGSYVFEANRVRPTFGGPRMYRGIQITALVMIGIGVLALAAGIVLQVANSGLPTWVVLSFVLGGVVLGIVGAILFPTIRLRRASLLIPEEPPIPYPAATNRM